MSDIACPSSKYRLLSSPVQVWLDHSVIARFRRSSIHFVSITDCQFAPPLRVLHTASTLRSPPTLGICYLAFWSCQSRTFTCKHLQAFLGTPCTSRLSICRTEWSYDVAMVAETAVSSRIADANRNRVVRRPMVLPTRLTLGSGFANTDVSDLL